MTQPLPPTPNQQAQQDATPVGTQDVINRFYNDLVAAGYVIQGTGPGPGMFGISHETDPDVRVVAIIVGTK